MIPISPKIVKRAALIKKIKASLAIYQQKHPDVFEYMHIVNDKFRGQVYVYGGFLRCIVSGNTPKDLDLLVLGDGSRRGDINKPLMSRLLGKFAGKEISHEYYSIIIRMDADPSLHVDIFCSDTFFANNVVKAPAKKLDTSRIYDVLDYTDFNANQIALNIQTNELYVSDEFLKIVDFDGNFDTKKCLKMPVTSMCKNNQEIITKISKLLRQTKLRFGPELLNTVTEMTF